MTYKTEQNRKAISKFNLSYDELDEEQKEWIENEIEGDEREELY